MHYLMAHETVVLASGRTVAGEARTFMDLVNSTFRAMEKFRLAGYDRPFTSLEEDVNDYVCNFLLREIVK